MIFIPFPFSHYFEASFGLKENAIRGGMGLKGPELEEVIGEVTFPHQEVSGRVTAGRVGTRRMPTRYISQISPAETPSFTSLIQ